MTRGPKPKKDTTASRRPPRGTKAVSNNLAPVNESMLAAAPADLSEQAAQVWSLCVSEMAANRSLRESDLPLIRSYCETIDIMWQAAASITKYGALIEFEELNDDGDVVGRSIKPNPAVRMHKDATGTARLLAGELGLSPMSRIRSGLMEAATGSMVIDIQDRLKKMMELGR